MDQGGNDLVESKDGLDTTFYAALNSSGFNNYFEFLVLFWKMLKDELFSYISGTLSSIS